MNFLRRLENVFSAVAFAEEGEHETARQILKENDQLSAEERGTEKAGRSKNHEHVYHSPSKV